MSNLDRFGGAEAWDAYSSRQDAQREAELKSCTCRQCRHFRTTRNDYAIKRAVGSFCKSHRMGTEEQVEMLACVACDAAEAFICIADGFEETDPDNHPIDSGCEDLFERI